MDRSVILITGALTGIGRATVLAFAWDGHRVAISGPNAETGEAFAAELRAGGELDEIAAAILFLASPAAAFVTGQIVMVDGGKTAG